MDCFQIGKGVRQGCILSPCLFNLYSGLFLLFLSHSVVSDSLQPHGLQHARPPCLSSSPGVCSNSCPLTQWCFLTISSHPLLLLPSFLPSIRVFSHELALHIEWPNYWNFSFSISPSNEFSGLISFRIDWLDLLAVQGTLQSYYFTYIFEVLRNPKIHPNVPLLSLPSPVRKY